MAAEIRRFTKEDWYAWAGCMKFHNGSDPFIYEDTLNDGSVEIVVIADADGIEIYMNEGEFDIEDSTSWYVEKSLTPIRAEGEIRAIVKEIQEYTSAPDLSYVIDHAGSEVFKGFIQY